MFIMTSTYNLVTVKENNCTLDNGVNKTLKIIGGKWKPLILWFLNQKIMRFNELMDSIAGVNQKMLIQQLRELESDGLVKRKVYKVVPPKVEYSITPKGKSLQKILKLMNDWGNTN